MDSSRGRGYTATEAVVSTPPSSASLMTLPLELIIEIIGFAKLSKSRKGLYFEDRSSLREMSRGCKLFRVFTISDLFKTVCRTVNENEIHSQLQAIENNALILGSIRHLSLCTQGPEWPPTKWRNDYDPSIIPCSRATAALLVKVLLKTTPEEVRLTFKCGNKSMVALFRAELGKQKACLQSVRVLTYPSSTTVSFIPQTFPNLRCLSLDLNGSLMHTAGLRIIAPKLKNLATVELYKAHWKRDDLKEVVKLFPSINYLLIDGELKFTRVSDLIPVLKNLNHLEKLALTEIPVVYPPRGLSGQALQARIKELRANHLNRESSTLNATRFFQQCKTLKALLLKCDKGARFYQSVGQSRDVIRVKSKNANNLGLGLIKKGWPVINKAA
ncbi:F-box domain-containing protein [Colletotrichum scovillei]|uniref:F-box domain-containing protein n=1 Tax=Colletotrichum scovillei TaxID=1209932 RepID=A0A9P7REW6_9PEZI|nr:F-box domain-containing protein [Colletotrichum scovillei]KAF4783933.1 F-box domain-containing protein [Colletotrichum scovillei]KAG7054364.1 F-box domain-containing protein [Colletotrichum scovillei]KAG7072654.1 F-box domain-containing protein [Colletotrichum scovillei]KAG7080896.1 F-box domain-containing protein [Colletotrichum scovillei]